MNTVGSPTLWVISFNTNITLTDTCSYHGSRGEKEAERADQDSKAAGGC